MPNELTYHLMTFSYVSDLTDPDATPVDVAVMGLGEAADTQVIVMVNVSPDKLDPFAEELIECLPAHVKQQLDQCSQLTSLREIVEMLHRSLRNSLYVSKVEGPFSLSIASESEGVKAVADRAAGRLPAGGSALRVRTDRSARHGTRHAYA